MPSRCVGPNVSSSTVCSPTSVTDWCGTPNEFASGTWRPSSTANCRRRPPDTGPTRSNAKSPATVGGRPCPADHAAQHGPGGAVTPHRPDAPSPPGLRRGTDAAVSHRCNSIRSSDVTTTPVRRNTPMSERPRSAPPERRDQDTGAQLTANGVPVHGHRPIRAALFMTVFCLGLFMTLLDITIVNIAIPDLVTDLSAGLETVLWVGSAYSLVYAVLLITAGRLGDIYGPRRLFMIGLAVFTAASLASGLSQTSGQLIAFRAVQGLGAALLAPQGLAMITSILPP